MSVTPPFLDVKTILSKYFEPLQTFSLFGCVLQDDETTCKDIFLLSAWEHYEQNTNISKIKPFLTYRGADKSLARPTSWCILFDDENISFDSSLVMYINSTNIPLIMIINRIYETQNILSL